MPQQPEASIEKKTLILACGALVRELRAVLATVPDSSTRFQVDYLPAPLHNRPEKITPAVAEHLDGMDETFSQIVLGYGDCGTGGHLDAFMQRWTEAHPQTPISRIPGDHCYAFLTGLDAFAELHDEELGTLFLTDFFARHFDLLLWQGLGLDEHPELLEMYFGNYKRCVYIAQTEDPDLVKMAEAAAEKLGLEYHYRFTGLGPFQSELLTLTGGA